MNFLISSAFADAAPTASTGGSLLSMLPMLVLLVAFMYFMVIRPQSKRAKEHKDLMGNLQVGDEVSTIGGVIGSIEKISGNFLVIAIDGSLTMIVQKTAIAAVLPHGTMKGIK